MVAEMDNMKKQVQFDAENILQTRSKGEKALLGDIQT
jgi:hypothetical protein